MSQRKLPVVYECQGRVREKHFLASRELEQYRRLCVVTCERYTRRRRIVLIRWLRGWVLLSLMVELFLER